MFPCNGNKLLGQPRDADEGAKDRAKEGNTAGRDGGFVTRETPGIW